MLTRRTALVWPRRLLVLATAPLALGIAGASTALSETALPAPGPVVIVSDHYVTPRVVTLAAPPVVARVVPVWRPPAVVHRVTRRPVVRPRAVVVSTTAQQRLDAAVAAIPGYRPGMASWTLTTRYGSWGTADWYTGQVFISPSVPANRIQDVVLHEWSHLLTVSAYGHDVNADMAAMNSWFGGTGLEGSETAADCMARVLGARWTHYTSCRDAHWVDGARRLVAGQRL